VRFKSAKELGLDACLAHDADALRARAHGAWARDQTVVAREYLTLRYTGETMMEFPHGREHRFILLDRAAPASAFYWDETAHCGCAVSQFIVPNAGHMFMAHKSLPIWINHVVRWLRVHGLSPRRRP
jgi:hypothetical protein